LIHILDKILPARQSGSISTLPIAWSEPELTPEQFTAAAEHLRAVARELAELEASSGRRITLALEPEPGCVLQRSGDVVRLFEDYLLTPKDEDVVRRYLTVCHDVCHAVVMFEEQAAVLKRYAQAGIAVGKVQVSSAVCCDFAQIAPAQRAAAIAQLSAFAEDRYLHQTMIKEAATGEAAEPESTNTVPVFYEDLPQALSAVENPTTLTSEWRIHFHVPVYLPSFGSLGTSQQAVLDCLAACRADSNVEHFEVETYAWGVLPEELQQADLASGIAAEMKWFGEQIN